MFSKLIKRKAIIRILDGHVLNVDEQLYLTNLIETSSYSFTDIQNIFKMLVNGITLNDIKPNIDKLQRLSNGPSLNRFLLLYPTKKAHIKFDEFKNKSKHTLEKFIEKFGKIKGQEQWDIHKNKCNPNKESFIVKYGKIKGIKLFNDYLEKKKTAQKGMYSKLWFIEKYGSEQGALLFEERNNRFTKETYITQHGEEAFNTKMKNATEARTIDTYISQYGNELGKQKYFEIQQKKGNSLDSMITKYGKEDGMKRYDSYLSKLRISNSKIGYIDKYGVEEGEKKWLSFVNKSKHTLNGYKEKYGEEQGILRFEEYTMKRIKSLQYETYIEKYGEEKGNKIWFEILERRIPKNKYSKISKQFFDRLVELNNVNKDDCFFAENEQCIILNEQEMLKLSKFAIYPDFMFGKIIIEFNGDYWHKIGCEKDKKRMEVLNDRGYTTYTVWESEYKAKGDILIQELSEKIAFEKLKG